MHDYPLTYKHLKDIELRRLVGKPLFGLGRLVATPRALELLTTAQCRPMRLLQRHQCGDWGELCPADKAANDQALLNGGRVLSLYRVDDIRLYVITEAVNDATGQRDSTCILLPSEY
ncbi:hypothetical protein [Acidovorax sp. HDW3]|uniref:hypothetical protein n=1 Tax=Acidovorax sp. HDW3 TaxID=2714923 RepID=UPI001F1091ED|nr:hypothetical protein [Acidovorax sp. HDW3]